MTATQKIQRFTFVGLHGRKAVCSLEIIPLADGRTLVTATERADNPGASVTNAAEELASQVCERLKIDPDKVVWIESYPANPCPVCNGRRKRKMAGSTRLSLCSYCRGTGLRRERTTFDVVTFRRVVTPMPFWVSSAGRRHFEEPQWRPMTAQDWAALGLEPK